MAMQCEACGKTIFINYADSTNTVCKKCFYDTPNHLLKKKLKKIDNTLLKNKTNLGCGNTLGTRNIEEQLPPTSQNLLDTCQSCDHQFSKRASICPKCDKERTSECFVCKKQIPQSSKFCSECGDPAPFEQQSAHKNENVAKTTYHEKTSIPKHVTNTLQKPHYKENQCLQDMKISTILFSFTGCSSRLHYWSVVPITLVIILILNFAISLELNSPEPDYFLIFGVFTACTPFIWAYWAVRVKRCHDRNKSWFWAFFMGQIPIIGWLWELIELGLFPRKSEGNKYTTSE